ncbi:MAG: molybdate ABC transporter substrate-binding protein [Pseudomonadota bacterium]
MTRSCRDTERETTDAARRWRPTRRTVIAAGLATLLPTSQALAALPRPLVFAAASLSEVLQDAGDAALAAGMAAPRFSFAASSALARQIDLGAPAEIFVSADRAWVDHLEAGGRLVPGSRRLLAGNALVVVAPRAMAPNPGPAAEILARLPEGGRIAVALTDAVPAGRYARSALESLGLWGSLRLHLAETDNVRSALALVARGEAPLGIVYATDAAAEPGVSVLARIPRSRHAPIRYPAALVAGATPPAAAFLDLLAGETGQALFARRGFTAPDLTG